MSVKFNFFEELLDQTSGGKLNHDKQRVLDLMNAVAINFIQFKKELEPPSSAVVALSANCGAALPQSIACGLTCISDKHLLLETIIRFIELNYRKNPHEIARNIVPGIGHPSIKGEDPRVKFLFEEFQDIAGERVSFYLKLQEVLSPLKINIGGAMCSLMLDAGINGEYISFFPLAGRIFGWSKIYRSINNRYSKVKPAEKIVNDNN